MIIFFYSRIQSRRICFSLVFYGHLNKLGEADGITALDLQDDLSACQEPWRIAQLCVKLLSRGEGARGCDGWLVLTSFSLALSHLFSQRYDANPTRAGSLGRGRGSPHPADVVHICIWAFASGSQLAPQAAARGLWAACEVGDAVFSSPAYIFFLSLRVTGELRVRQNVPAYIQGCVYVPVSYL